MASPSDAQAATGAGAWRGYAAITFAVLVWAGWIVATREQVSRLSPLDISLVRYGAPALLLCPLWLRKGIFPRGENPWRLLVMATGWGWLFVVLTATGLETVETAYFGPLVPATLPVFVALWDKLAERQRLGRPRTVGVALICGSIALILGPALARGDWGVLRGAPYLLSAAMGWSAFTIAYRGSRLNGLEATAYVALYSLPFLGAGALMFDTHLGGLSPGGFAWLLLVQGVLSGIGAVAGFGYAVQFLGAARTSSFTSLVPALAALGGWMALGERVGPLEWLSVALACLGVAVVNGAFGGLLRRI